jgi:hypothetical protein
MHAGRTPLLAIAALPFLAPNAGAQPILRDDPEPARGTIALSARAAFRESSHGRRDWLGAISLVVPLERLAAPPRRATQATQAALAEPEPKSEPEPAREIELVVTPELARAAVHAALRAGGYPASRRRLEGLARRANSSALLPELRLRGAHTTDESLRLAPTTTDPYRYTQAGGTSVTLEARLTWKLDRLVFADEELHVERMRGQRAGAARTLVREVLRALVAWQRAAIRAEDPGLAPAERLDAMLDALEAEVALDVMTNGWFSWRLRRLAKPGDPR